MCSSDLSSWSPRRASTRSYTYPHSTKKVVKVHKVSPRTGDASMIFLYGGLVVGAVVVLMVLIKIRRRA